MTDNKQKQPVSGGESGLQRPLGAKDEALSAGQRPNSDQHDSGTCHHAADEDCPALRPTPQFGSAKGLVRMADDFDEPICADLDAVIEGLAGTGEREETERLRRVDSLIPWPCKNERHAECEGETVLRRDGAPSRCNCHCHQRQLPISSLDNELDKTNRAARTAWSDAYPEARGAPRHQFKSQGFFPRCGVCNGKQDSPYHYDAESCNVQTDANATLNLLRELEQRVQAVHRCGNAEQARLLLVAIKGILNGAIAEREAR